MREREDERERKRTEETERKRKVKAKEENQKKQLANKKCVPNQFWQGYPLKSMRLTNQGDSYLLHRTMTQKLAA